MIDARKGRPRDQRIDDEVTTAALDLLADVGFDRFSVEEVAARAGVAKTTIYRRFPTRTDLLVGALERLNDDLVLPDPSLPVRVRLIESLSSVRRRKAGVEGRDRLLYLAGADCRDADLRRLVRERVIAPRRAGMRSILSDGVASGELRADLDLDAAVAVLVGAVLYLSSADQRGEEPTTGVADAVDCALHGLAAPA